MPKRKSKRLPQKSPTTFLGTVWEYFRVISSALILALLIRFFLVEPYKIPSGSMVPTLLIGDYLFVNKLAYNIRLPFTDVYFQEETPKRGDVVVFKRKVDHPPGSWFGFGDTYFIKRVVAVPGDTISYQNKRLVVNGKVAQLKPVGHYMYQDSHGSPVDGERYVETLHNTRHDVLLLDEYYGQSVSPATVPEGKVVVVGDNRDNSGDSRVWDYPRWGYVPQRDILGRAEFIWWSWDANFIPRFERLLNNLRIERLDEESPQQTEGTYVN